MGLRRMPAAILFACNLNAARSPIAENLMRHFHGRSVWVQSAGVEVGPLDPFAVRVMAEIGLDMSRHHPKSFDELDDSSFDLIVALSPEAERVAVAMTRTMDCAVELWNTPDPSQFEGTQERVLEAYRDMRHALLSRILSRFPIAKGAVEGIS